MNKNRDICCDETYFQCTEHIIRLSLVWFLDCCCKGQSWMNEINMHYHWVASLGSRSILFKMCMYIWSPRPLLESWLGRLCLLCSFPFCLIYKNNQKSKRKNFSYVKIFLKLIEDRTHFKEKNLKDIIVGCLIFSKMKNLSIWLFSSGVCQIIVRIQGKKKTF